jgi:tol-pal system protein YbgF
MAHFGPRALALLLLVGCARTAEERHLDAMRDEIDRIQADRDHESASTPETDAEPKGAQNRVPPSVAAQPPVPEPVSLGAGDQAPLDYADTEDPMPRPTLRVLGSSRSGVRNPWRGDDAVEASASPDGKAAAVRSSALDPEAKRAYDAALSLMYAHQYDRALDAFAKFLVTWPDHPYADNAMYWRGECYFAQGQYLRASEQFEGVLARSPMGNKAPDAMLKLGMSHQKLGSPEKAKEVFDRLAAQYPQSQAAHRIPPVTASAATSPGPASEEHR